MVDTLVSNPIEPMMALLLISARLVGFVVFLPLFGTGTLPVRFRVLFAVLIAFVLLPTGSSQVILPKSMAIFGTSLVQELILGLALGTGVRLIFGGLDVAGKLMGELSGLSIARTYDETVLASEAPQAFLQGFAGCIFLAFGGHRLLVEGILESFASLPPGEAHFDMELLPLLLSVLSQSFQFGIRVAAPAVLAMFVASFTIGIVTRSAPQLSSLTMGMGLNVLLLFAVLLVSLGAVGWVFQDFVEQASAEILSSVKGRL